MSIQKRFSEAFGLSPDYDVERRAFVHRISETVFHEAITGVYGMFYDELLKRLCFELGISSKNLIDDYNDGAIRRRQLPNIQYITKDDFTKTLQVTCMLYKVYSEANWVQQSIEGHILKALELSLVDIGIRWNDGMFYPSASKLLDSALVDDPLGCLKSYPEIRDVFILSVKDYSGKKPKEMAAKCFNIIERLTNVLLQNEKGLEKNHDALLAALNLSGDWKAMLGHYMQYIHKYSRHGESIDKELNQEEAEALLYMTGLFIRLIIKAHNNGTESLKELKQSG